MENPTATLAPWNRGDLEQLLGLVERMKCTLCSLESKQTLSLITANFPLASAQTWTTHVIGTYIVCQVTYHP